MRNKKCGGVNIIDNNLLTSQQTCGIIYLCTRESPNPPARTQAIGLRRLRALTIFSVSLQIEIHKFRGLCSFYAEKGGVLVGFEKA